MDLTIHFKVMFGTSHLNWIMWTFRCVVFKNQCTNHFVVLFLAKSSKSKETLNEIMYLHFRNGDVETSYVINAV